MATRYFMNVARDSFSDNHTSWGRYPKAFQQELSLYWISDDYSAINNALLPYGLGRSYGDSCLNNGGTLLLTSALNKYLSFDIETGILECEAGVTFEQILDDFVPRGWFLPVTPGTKFITVGGAIANDIHGKNHHRAGTFGCHVKSFSLKRATGEVLVCSDAENREFFEATVGGLGLTGLILTAKFQLKKIGGPCIDQDIIKFNSLEEFFTLSQDSENFEYSVSWIDCFSKELCRGLFIRGNHSVHQGPMRKKKSKIFPFDLPRGAMNSLTIKTFNGIYFHRNLKDRTPSTIHYDPFFYPLDGILKWNRLYGKAGFLQHQCLIPYNSVAKILKLIKESGTGSFLSVLKTFGSVKSPGLLSFPRPGVTLAMDFPIRNASTFELLNKIDNVVQDSGGAVYPAKDARMKENDFKAFFPKWREFQKFIDPKFSSGFAKRVGLVK